MSYLIPVHVNGIGEAPVYSINFNRKEISRWVYFFSLMTLLGVVYLIYKFREKRRRKRNNEIQMNIEDVEDNIAWN